ncbi:hypothetical protein PO587_11020 [Streptomyces gilvifuscus]|uniref:Uncharacterized protein n=1 Tax=Streptomyces gilvifuscus TaxID=1550617 RepID=A0ABT5FR43_9ACTN|nr:hypothetical protein [Streptomyces gilvifuscus]MDC2954997.1 hypothetical protein [Streptomyces gilvifuscus]
MMMSLPARVGAALGAAAGFVLVVTRGGPSVWVVTGLTVGVLALVGVVLFVPSETPARRLGQLIRAWRHPSAPDRGAT